ncbi:MAG: hypothetical protein ACK48G_10675 [Chitinophagaceae bacterium]
MKKDDRGRIRFFSLIQPDTVGTITKSKAYPFQFNVEPILQGMASVDGDGNRIITRGVGLQLWASLGKRWGFQMYYRDVSEEGDGIDFEKQFTSDPGVIKVTNPSAKSLNYADVRASMHYQWNSGQVSIGKEQYVVGYGLNGNMIHSLKAPTYPYIRVQQKILPRLRFEYVHGILSSGLVDTPNSYRVNNGGVFGGQRFKPIPKYYVNHSLMIRLMKGLDLQVGESVIYTDRIQAGYWLPVMFFKAWDQYFSGNTLNAGSNTQFYGQISSRNQLKNTHLYATLFVDEISPQVIFNRAKSRNQLGFNIGGSVTDLPGLPYVTINAEYARINPFVYQNLLPAQDFNSSGYGMGDWMGSNADRLIGEIRYTPIPRLRIVARQQFIRKGAKGTVEQQYFAQPQPEFLFGYWLRQSTTMGKMVYEWKQNLYFHAQAMRVKSQYFQPNSSNTTRYFLSAGFALGL